MVRGVQFSGKEAGVLKIGQNIGVFKIPIHICNHSWGKNLPTSHSDLWWIYANWLVDKSPQTTIVQWGV